MINRNIRIVGGMMILALCAVVAQAGSINAAYSSAYGFPGVSFSTVLPGNVGPMSSPAGQMNGQRIDVPGPGVDTLVPFQFPAFCVELGETISVPGNNAHPDVFPLLGSVTTGGGISGPVLFDPVRTANLQTLWGSFFGAVNNATTAQAFQLAQWEIAFDDDVTLIPGAGAKLFVTAGDFQPGISDLAENWLTLIRSGQATTQMPLVHLKGAGIQDLVTPGNPVPEPASIAALGLGVAALVRRRKAKKA